MNLRLLEGSQNQSLMTFRLPSEEFRDTRGFGKTEDEARQNALQLRNMLLREEALHEIVRRIGQAIENQLRNRAPATDNR